MVQMGMPPDVYEKQNLFKMMDILSAKPREDRKQDALDLLNNLGINVTKLQASFDAYFFTYFLKGG